MAIGGYCGGECGCMEKCNDCKLDLSMPCSPSCKNLTEDGMINIAGCLRDECEEVKYIFYGHEDVSAEEILKEYGEIAQYPY